MEIAEVTDAKSLRAYLFALPADQRHDVAVRVAFRSAARVLPIIATECLTADRAQERDSSFVASFGAILGSGGYAVGHPADQDAALAAAFGVKTGESAFAAGRSAFAAAQAVVSANDIIHAHDTAEAAARAAADAADYNLWPLIRMDLAEDTAKQALWPDGPPAAFVAAWDAATRAMKDHVANWDVWVHWYRRVLSGQDWHPAAMIKVLNTITEEDWDKGPAHNNPMFDEVLAIYRAEDEGGNSGDAQPKTLHVKAIRAQVSTLQDLLEAEYLKLSGHNARTPLQDEILDLLKQLRSLVEHMMSCFEEAVDDQAALATIRSNLPVVVEKTGELALIEPEPRVSETVVAMSVIIKTLTDAGADPKMATQIAMTEVAGKKVWPRLKQMFGRIGLSDGADGRD